MNLAPARLAIFVSALALPLYNASLAQAANIPIPNYSFEEDWIVEDADGNSDNHANSTITSWKASGDPKFGYKGTYDPGEEFFGAKGRHAAPKMHGYKVVHLWTRCTLQSEESLATVEPGVTYTLKVAIGDANLKTSEPGRLQVGFMIGDGITQESTDTFDANDGTPEGTFDDYTFSYTATQADAGKTLKIYFSLLDQSGSVSADNFRLTTNG